MATHDGKPIDTETSQPEPGSGTPQPVPDGREYWRRRALRAEADGYRRGVEAAIAPLRGMKTNERTGYMAAIPQTKEMCAYTALILLECMGRIRALVKHIEK